MSKGSKSKAPPAPDPVKVAQAQADANIKTAQAQTEMNRQAAIEQTWMNAVNQYTPYGQTEFVQTGTGPNGVPLFAQRTTFSPTEQALYDRENAISQQLLGVGQGQLGRVEQQFATPWSYEGIADYGAVPTAPGQADNASRDAVVAALMSRAQPDLDREQARLESRLAAQGITPGSAAWAREMDAANRMKTDTRFQAELYGSQEHSRMNEEAQRIYEMQRQQMEAQNALRERQIQERAYARNLPLEELTKLLGTANGASLPQFSPMPVSGLNPAQLAATDIMNPTYRSYEGQMKAWEAQQKARSASIGAILGAAGTIAGGFMGGPTGAYVGGQIGSKLGGN